MAAATRARSRSPEVVEPRVGVGRQLAQGREARRRRDRAAVERAAVADGARATSVEDAHDVGPAAERRERIAAADDLAERRQVGPDPEPLLGAARRDPERDDLVEDQERPGPIREIAQELEEPGFRRRARRRRPGRAR